MSRYDYDIGVIGGGAAGLTVASGAAQLGARTVLIDKEGRLGGDCLHYGCVPSKTLIKSAAVYHQLQRLEEFGLPPVVQPPLDFAALRRRIAAVIGAIQQHDSVERFTSLGVAVKFGEAAFSDNHLVDLGSTRVSARKWVVATGSSPALPPLPGLSDIGACTNREIFSLETLPESLLVIGAGPIGIEMAQAFARLGSRVTVLQRGPRILSREDEALAGELQEKMAREGVVFHLGCTMESASAAGGVKTVRIRTAAGESLAVQGAEVLIGAGRSPNIDGLKLDKAGVSCNAQGIAVDRRLRTSSRNIFAAGDVTGAYQFTHAAGYEGGIVVANAVLGLPRKTDYRWLPHCTYSDPELGGLGLSENQARARGLDFTVHEERFADNDRARAEGESEGRIKVLLDSRERILGVRILGYHAGELLSQWVTILNGGVRPATVAGSVHPYPTMAEINKRVIGAVFSEKIFSDRVRAILRVIHRYRG